MVVVGMGALGRGDGAAVLSAVRAIAETDGMVQPATTDEDGETVAGWNGFNVLHTAAARVGGLDLGFVPGEGGADVAGILAGAGSGAIRLVYLLGADEIDTAALGDRSEEHTSELQSLMRISYAVFCLKKKTKIND